MLKDAEGDRRALDDENMQSVQPFQNEKDPEIDCASMIVLLVFAVASVVWCIGMVATSRSTGNAGPGAIDMSHAHPSNYPRNR